MDFFDKFKDLFKREVPRSQAEAIFNRLDVDQAFNFMSNLYHPSELIQKIGGIQNLEYLYKDPEIYAAVDKRLAALLDTRLVLESKSDELVKFFEDQLLDHEQQLKQDFWWAVPYGFAVEQIVYDPDRSCKVIGFQKEDFWRFEPLPDLIHVRLVSTTRTELMNKVLPYGKWVVATNNGTYSNPVGDPMFERLIQPWIFRCNGWDLWMDFAKRFSNGFMHGRIEDESQVKEFRKTLETAAKSAIIVTDKNSELSLIQPSRDSSIYDMIDSKTIATFQKVILGETQTSDMQERGSSASAGIHNEVRLEKTRADIRLVEKSLDETIWQIAAVCGIDDSEDIPKAKLIYDPGLNQELATRDTSLNSIGVRFTKKYFINNYGFKEDDFDVVDPAPASPFGFSSKKKKSLYLKPEEVKDFLGLPEDECPACRNIQLAPNVSRKDNRQQNEKEDVVDYLKRNGEEPINMDDLIAAIQRSKNESDLDKNLSALFDQRSVTFIDTLTESLYYSASKGALLGNPERLETDEEE